MKKPVNIKKLLLPNLPYVFIGLFATNLGEAFRLMPGADLSEKLLHITVGFSAMGRENDHLKDCIRRADEELIKRKQNRKKEKKSAEKKK